MEVGFVHDYELESSLISGLMEEVLTVSCGLPASGARETWADPLNPPIGRNDTDRTHSSVSP